MNSPGTQILVSTSIFQQKEPDLLAKMACSSQRENIQEIYKVSLETESKEAETFWVTK